jgi:hypothetical protein
MVVAATQCIRKREVRDGFGPKTQNRATGAWFRACRVKRRRRGDVSRWRASGQMGQMSGWLRGSFINEARGGFGPKGNPSRQDSVWCVPLKKMVGGDVRS